MSAVNSTSSGYIFLFVVQIIFIVVFAFYVRYDNLYMPKSSSDEDAYRNEMITAKHIPSYKHFQDMHVMIFVGFGFLMTFLKKYAYSSLGFNLFVASITIQCSLLFRGCFRISDGYIKLNLDDMISAEVAAAVILISMGAILGRTTLVQLSVMAIVETLIYATNEFLQYEIVKITDAAASITLHGFGAYFGLGVALILRPQLDENGLGKNESSTYASDITAMIGTLFLWIYWPSFNTAGLDDEQQMRGILNTYIALTGATIAAFVVSSLVTSENKLNIVHVQNATLAGGVAVGAICNLLIGPHGALLVGTMAGIISTMGYQYLSPVLMSKLRLHDTCGVNNLHGMPAILSGMFSAIYASMATKELYKNSLTDIYPAMSDVNSTMAIEYNNPVIGGFGRTANQQAAYQILGVVLTVIIAMISGLITGGILKLKVFKQVKRDEQHDDMVSWHVPEN